MSKSPASPAKVRASQTLKPIVDDVVTEDALNKGKLEILRTAEELDQAI